MGTKCPNCQHSILLKDAKPGKYKPKCPKCQVQFLLIIPADRNQPPSATRFVIPPTQETKLAEQPQLVATGPKPAPKSASTVVGNYEATLAPSSSTSVSAEAKQVHPPTIPDQPSAAVSPSAKTVPGKTNDLTEFYASNPDVPRMPGSTALEPGTPTTINGYRVVRELGRGAMGAVYLAKQMSLDREVAVKTIQSQWASNPAFIARFTREAYAAAQLSHHNVVQIYDLGQDHDVNFFSMEYVRGRSLDNIIKERGKLDAEAAVGFVLQAARGLQYAHSLGMVHRDVKPGNILVNEQGIVKVTDLGLVKTPELAEELDALEERGFGGQRGSTLMSASAQMTVANVAMGTPAYMAPEQAENAAGVDHRADIYSLGCTLYVLLTGRPPFEGASAMEVITKHKSEPVMRPEAIVKRIPPALSEITLKMVAKRPEDRYPNMIEVVKALEAYLGVTSSGPYSPKEEQATRLEQAIADFNRPLLVRLRDLIPPIFFVSVLLIALLLTPFRLGLATAIASLAIFTPLIYGVLTSFDRPGPVISRLRQLLFELRIADWLTYGCGGLLLIGILFLIGWLWFWLAAAVVAALLAFGFQFLFDKQLAAQRKPALDNIEPLLRSLRLQGVEEAALHQFVAKYSGEQWEEFFEQMFGYDNKRIARDQWGRNPQGNLRPKFRGWRDRIVNWADDRLRVIQELRDRQHLKNVEAKHLAAQGYDLVTAHKQAERVADAMIDEAAEQRSMGPVSDAGLDPAVIAQRKKERIKAMLADARAGKLVPKNKHRLVAAAATPITFLLGPQVRLLLGCLLMGLCVLWAQENGLLTEERVQQLRTAVNERDVEGIGEAAIVDEIKPLSLPIIGPFIDSALPGGAGLLLFILAMFGGWRMSLFALPAAAIMVFGPHLIDVGDDLAFWRKWIFLVIGLAIGIAGIMYGQTVDDRVRDNE